MCIRAGRVSREGGRTVHFVGKRHDNKMLKVQISWSRNFVVIAQAPTIDDSDQKTQKTQGIISFEEFFLYIFFKFLGDFISVRIHAAPVFTPARTQE